MNNANNITLLISIVGACAWLPEIWKLIKYSRSKLEASVIDMVHIKNCTMTPQNKKMEPKKGQMLVLAIVFFNYYKSFFVRDFQIEIILHRNGETARKATIGNAVKYWQSKEHRRLALPFETNFFANPLIISGENNVRIIPCLIEDISADKISMYDIKEIKFTYEDQMIFRRKKTIKIKCDADRFSNPNYISQYVEKMD